VSEEYLSFRISSRTKKEVTMEPFEMLPTTSHIKLIARVYPLGGIDVRYAPAEGDAPIQSGPFWKPF
jgi:hypothetical protein